MFRRGDLWPNFHCFSELALFLCKHKFKNASTYAFDLWDTEPAVKYNCYCILYKCFINILRHILNVLSILFSLLKLRLKETNGIVELSNVKRDATHEAVSEILNHMYLKLLAWLIKHLRRSEHSWVVDSSYEGSCSNLAHVKRWVRSKFCFYIQSSGGRTLL